jgi:hypothetical protein
MKIISHRRDPANWGIMPAVFQAKREIQKPTGCEKIRDLYQVIALAMT